MYCVEDAGATDKGCIGPPAQKTHLRMTKTLDHANPTPSLRFARVRRWCMQSPPQPVTFDSFALTLFAC